MGGGGRGGRSVTAVIWCGYPRFKPDCAALKEHVPMCEPSHWNVSTIMAHARLERQLLQPVSRRLSEGSQQLWLLAEHLLYLASPSDVMPHNFILSQVCFRLQELQHQRCCCN